MAPSVSISAPAVMVPPTAAASPYVTAPGSPLTFRGSATDDEDLNYVEIRLRNTTTRENLAADGTFSENAIYEWYRISPLNLTRHQLQLELHDAVQPQAREATRSRSGRPTTSA